MSEYKGLAGIVTGGAEVEEMDEAGPVKIAQAGTRVGDGETRGRGRPATGKRSDPEYERSGVLIRKATRKRTAGLLLNYPDKDFSELVEELLTSWNNEHS